MTTQECVRLYEEMLMRWITARRDYPEAHKLIDPPDVADFGLMRGREQPKWAVAMREKIERDFRRSF